jgi:hypothetical protein
MPDTVVNQDPNVQLDPNLSPDHGDPGGSPSWRESLPPELKAEKSLESFKDVAGLAKSYVDNKRETSKLVNSKGIIVPGEKATPEEIAAFHKALGRPDTPDGYGLEKPDLPEGMTYDEVRTKAFAEVAHKEGLTPKQLKALHTAWNEQAKAEFERQVKAVKEFTEKTTAEMKKEWGKDFEANLVTADAAIEKVFGPEFKKMLKDTGLANHPAIIKGMFKASQAIGEHALTSRGAGNRDGSGPLSKSELRIRMNDPRYWDPSRRDNDFVKATVRYAEDLTTQEVGVGANS